MFLHLSSIYTALALPVAQISRRRSNGEIFPIPRSRNANRTIPRNFLPAHTRTTPTFDNTTLPTATVFLISFRCILWRAAMAADREFGEEDMAVDDFIGERGVVGRFAG